MKRLFHREIIEIELRTEIENNSIEATEFFRPISTSKSSNKWTSTLRQITCFTNTKTYASTHSKTEQSPLSIPLYQLRWWLFDCDAFIFIIKSLHRHQNFCQLYKKDQQKSDFASKMPMDLTEKEITTSTTSPQRQFRAAVISSLAWIDFYISKIRSRLTIERVTIECSAPYYNLNNGFTWVTGNRNEREKKGKIKEAGVDSQREI